MKPGVLVNGGGTGEGGGGTYVVAIAREIARGGDRGLAWNFLASARLVNLISEAAAPVALPPMGVVRRTLWEQFRLTSPRDGVLVAAAGYGPMVRRGPFVLVAHNALHYRWPKFGGRPAIRLFVESTIARGSARRASAVLAPTESMASLVAAGARVPALASPFGPGLVDRRIPSCDGRFVFLHRTQWGPHKGFRVLLKAVQTLAAKRPRSFVLRSACDPHGRFAATYPRSAPERELLEDPLVASHLELASFVIGSAAQRELSGDAVVMPSETESFCFPIAEALCFGLPVVAVDRPYARELCGPAAFFVAPDDPAALALAMEQLIDGERPPMPRQDRLARLSWARHVDDLASAVTRAAAEDRSSSDSHHCSKKPLNRVIRKTSGGRIASATSALQGYAASVAAPAG